MHTLHRHARRGVGSQCRALAGNTIADAHGSIARVPKHARESLTADVELPESEADMQRARGGGLGAKVRGHRRPDIYTSIGLSMRWQLAHGCSRICGCEGSIPCEAHGIDRKTCAGERAVFVVYWLSCLLPPTPLRASRSSLPTSGLPSTPRPPAAVVLAQPIGAAPADHLPEGHSHSHRFGRRYLVESLTTGGQQAAGRESPLRLCVRAWLACSMCGVGGDVVIELAAQTEHADETAHASLHTCTPSGDRRLHPSGFAKDVLGLASPECCS